MTNKPASIRRILAIVNPAAGGGRGARRFTALRDALERWPGRLRVETTSRRGDAECLAADAATAGTDTVVAVGGDGTVHEIVNGILSAEGAMRPALAVVSVGTGCDFARSLGLPARASAVPPRRRVRVDVGAVTCITARGPEKRFFLNAANVGASTAAARRIKDSRVLKRLGAVAYVAAGFPEVLMRPVTQVGWGMPGGEQRVEQLLNLSICNGPRFGGGLMLVPEATLFDGVLRAVRIQRGGLGGLLKLLAAGYRQSPLSQRDVDVDTVTRLAVTGDAVIETDGELVGTLPAQFTVLPGALEVLLP